MIKHEIKVEFNNTDFLKSLIERAYFQEGLLGKIIGKSHFIPLNEEIEAEAFSILDGLNSVTVKITNNDIIDGSMRFIVDVGDELRLYPISIYCVKEGDKYSFY